MQKRNIFCVVLLLFLFSASAFAQEDSDDLEYWNQIATELSQQSTILETAQLQQDLALNLQEAFSIAASISENLPTDISIYLQSLQSNKDIQSMSLSELLKLTKTLYNWQNQVSTTYLTSVSEKLNLMNSLSEKLLNCQSLAQKALESSRDDVHNALIELGLAQEQIDSITIQKEILLNQLNSIKELAAENEKRLNNCYRFGNLLAPLFPVGLTVTGAAVYNYDNQLGKNLMIAGCISLVSIEVVYQGGHWIFRFW